MGTVKYSADAQVSTTVKGGGLKYNQDGTISGFDFKAEDAGVAGLGFGIDLGASYKVLDNLTVSAAVLDLGYITGRVAKQLWLLSMLLKQRISPQVTIRK